jgi:hypothetical protein
MYQSYGPDRLVCCHSPDTSVYLWFTAVSRAEHTVIQYLRCCSTNGESTKALSVITTLVVGVAFIPLIKVSLLRGFVLRTVIMSY